MCRRFYLVRLRDHSALRIQKLNARVDRGLVRVSQTPQRDAYSRRFPSGKSQGIAEEFNVFLISLRIRPAGGQPLALLQPGADRSRRLAALPGSPTNAGVFPAPSVIEATGRVFRAPAPSSG